MAVSMDQKEPLAYPESPVLRVLPAMSVPKVLKETMELKVMLVLPVLMV